MKIYIPTRGRVDRQITLSNIPEALYPSVSLVTIAEERVALTQRWGSHVTVLAPKVQGIGDTRQWIFKHALASGDPYFVMMDDDLTFATRNPDDRTKFLSAKPKDVVAMVKAIEKNLKTAAMVSVLMREGGNRITAPFIECSRACRLYAYDATVLQTHRVQFNQCGTMDDFDVTLQLLRAGAKNRILCDWVQNQGGSQTAGGAADYRTMESHAASAHRLKERHPDFVKVVQKETKTSWGGGTRTDVVVSWKKAYASSQS